jgi:hypothetical protein
MSVKVKGLDKLLADLDKKNNLIVDSVKDTLARTANEIETEAIRNAPSSYQIGDDRIDLSFIRQKIDKRVSNNGLLWNVGLNVPTTGEQWEAWMEFGTGLSAEQILRNPTYSQEVITLAQTYFRNGRGRIIGQPYLMPAFFRNTANLVTDIENEIKKDLG